jgi:hypothetical protein
MVFGLTAEATTEPNTFFFSNHNHYNICLVKTVVEIEVEQKVV